MVMRITALDAVNDRQDFKVLLANCLTHGRRSFVGILQNFPDECRHVKGVAK